MTVLTVLTVLTLLTLCGCGEDEVYRNSALETLMETLIAGLASNSPASDVAHDLIASL